MTIILAIPAKDGVVLASDGQITYADDIRDTGKKIVQLSKKCLWAASGRGALIQRVQEKLSAFPEKENPLEGLRDILAPTIKNCVNELFQLDQQPPQESFVFVEYMDKPRILQVVVTGTPEWITTGPFAIGIGRMFAHALLQKYADLFPAKIDVKKASLLAYKIIEESIAVGGWGLGPPIDIWQVTQNGAKSYSEEEMAALEETYLGLKKAEIEMFLRGSE